MSFDDNYPLGGCCDAYNGLPDYPDDFEALWAFDRQPVPSGPGAQLIQRTLCDAAGWLRSEPRTSLSIIFHLFPGMVRTMSDFEDAAALVGGYLMDAGYAARHTGTCNPTWYWLGGDPQ
jgi:hypothetical protein